MSQIPPLTPLPDAPLVSIIVPSFNQGSFIRETIESCLAQNYRPIEILVMDGGSTDATVDVLRAFGRRPELRWWSEKDDGVADAVNRGVARAAGPVCAVQSSDDYYLPGTFAQAVGLLREHPEAALAYADAVKVDAVGRELSRFVTGRFSITRFLSKQTVVLQPAAFFRKAAFEAVGGWSRDTYVADTECWLRMIVRHPAVKVDAFWACRRMHDEQRDTQRPTILEAYERMLATSAALRSGPRRWRRAAECGRVRHALRYGPSRSPGESRRMLWRAVRAWPPVLLDPEVAGCLLPGYLALRRRLGRREESS